MREEYREMHLEKYMPYPFIKQEVFDEVYGQIYVDEITSWEEGAVVKVNISLVNEKMLNMEYEGLENASNSLFFYEFAGEVTFSSRGTLAKYAMLGNWSSNRYCVFRIIDMETVNADQNMLFKEFGNRPVFIGEILFSASPILSHKVAIVVEGFAEDKNSDAYQKLKKIYDTWDADIKKRCIYNDANIISRLKTEFDTVRCKKVDIYNVGQANCCFCDLDSKKLFFDIGVTRSQSDRNSKLINNAINIISKLTVDAVILSHWDLDHILGVCYHQNCLKNTLWIVPDFEKLYKTPRMSIIRLCNFLLRNGNSEILMIDTSTSPKTFFVSSNKEFSLYKGEPIAAHGINQMNNGGLILKLSHNKNVLMPGDCENSIIPTDATKDELDNVIVPHHGSFMSLPRMIGKKGKRNKAYVCCGKKSGNCKLDDDLEEKYKRNNFSIIRYTKYLKKNEKYTIRL